MRKFLYDIEINFTKIHAEFILSQKLKVKKIATDHEETQKSH